MIKTYPTSRDKNWQKEADAMTVRLALRWYRNHNTSSFGDEAYYNCFQGSSFMEKDSKGQAMQGRTEKDSKANLDGKPERTSLSKLCFFLYQPELSGLPVWEGITIWMAKRKQSCGQ